MRFRRAISAAGLLVALAGAALAGGPKPSYRLPHGWKVRSDDKNGIYVSNGEGQIVMKRTDDKAAASLAPELYGGRPEPANALVDVSTMTVGGARAKRLVRRYESYHGGGETGGTESVYEEIVVVPLSKKGAVWTLDYETPRRPFHTEPRGGLDDWKAFLRSFKPR